MFGQKELLREPIIAKVNHTTCIGCFTCKEVCAYKAIEPYEIKDKKGNLIKRVAEINKGKYQGCGACAVAWPTGAAAVYNAEDGEVLTMVAAALE